MTDRSLALSTTSSGWDRHWVGAAIGGVLLAGCQQSDSDEQRPGADTLAHAAPAVAVDTTPRAQLIYAMIDPGRSGQRSSSARFAPDALLHDGDAMQGVRSIEDVVPRGNFTCRLASVTGAHPSRPAPARETVLAIWACRGGDGRAFALRRNFLFNGDLIESVHTGAPPPPMGNSNG